MCHIGCLSRWLSFREVLSELMNLKPEDAKNNMDSAIDYGLIRDELISVATAASNKLEREWPQKYSAIGSAREFFVATLRLAINTYKTIIYICADNPVDHRRDKMFCLSVPPLNRTILENLMTVVFVIEDIQKRTQWFYKSSYREWKETLEKYKRDYGQAPEWESFIDTMENYVINQLPGIGLSQKEIDDTKKQIKYWPNPGKMAKNSESENSGNQTAVFLSYLNDWFYKALSGQSHLNAIGLVQRGMFLAGRDIMGNYINNAEKIIEEQLDQFRNEQVWLAIILLLALTSEIDMHFKYDLNNRLKYIWGLIIPSNEKAKELYERRYETS